eukprot:1382807-Prymnesium_polylepis.1
MEDDAPAPTLSLAELEEQFAELQAVLHEKDEAVAKVERLSVAKPGTEEYDDVFSEQGTDGNTCAVIQQLIEQWNAHIDELDDEEGRIFDLLTDHGYDMRHFYEQKLLRPIVDFAAGDDADK